MLIACWSAKGGAGTTVIAAALALVAGRSHAGGALLADLGGDAPAALGLPEPHGPGLAGWLRAGPDVPADALARLEVEADAALGLLPRGDGELDGARGDVLVSLLRAERRPTVVDCGADPAGVPLAVAAAATRSILVTRPCFLSLRRAQHAIIRPSEVVLVTEPGRALSRRDVEDCVGAPVVAEVALDPAVARAVDAGLLLARLPRGLARDLARAA
jgi:hypothetical protein